MLASRSSSNGLEPLTEAEVKSLLGEKELIIGMLLKLITKRDEQIAALLREKEQWQPKP